MGAIKAFAALCARPALQVRVNRTKSTKGTELRLDRTDRAIEMGLVLLAWNGFTSGTTTRRNQFVELTLMTIGFFEQSEGNSIATRKTVKE